MFSFKIFSSKELYILLCTVRDFMYILAAQHSNLPPLTMGRSSLCFFFNQATLKTSFFVVFSRSVQCLILVRGNYSLFAVNM